MSESNGNGTLLKKDQIKQRNEKILRGWMHIWVRNSAQSWADKLIGDSNNLSHLAGKHKGEPALITGSGPSLTDSLETLNGHFPGVVFATNSSVSACLRHGLKPDYIHVFDGQYKPERLDGISVEGSTLIGCTTLDPEMWKFWKDQGPMYAFHMYDPNHKFFEEIQWYYWTFDALPTSGSVAPNAVRLAAYMGCDPIIITGLDLGFTNGKYRVDQYAQKDGQWETKPYDHLKAINRQAISIEKGCPCWRITGLLYKTAMVQISNQLKSEGLVYMRIVKEGGGQNMWNLRPMIAPGSKNTTVLNATTGGIWENELPRLDLAAWVNERKVA